MKHLRGLSQFPESQYKALATVVVVVAFFTGILNAAAPSIFQRFIGDWNPLLILAFSALLGFLLLSFLLHKGWFAIHQPGKLKKALRHSWLAAAFALVTIAADLNAPLSQDINIPFPESLLFYPAIGFVAEIAFHILPLSMLLFVLDAALKKGVGRRAIWFSFVLVAAIEPIYQLAFMDTLPLWAVVIISINLFLFGLAQLRIFQRYGFLAMYLFRLLYYLLWHILWGHLRLSWLF